MRAHINVCRGRASLALAARVKHELLVNEHVSVRVYVRGCAVICISASTQIRISASTHICMYAHTHTSYTQMFKSETNRSPRVRRCSNNVSLKSCTDAVRKTNTYVARRRPRHAPPRRACNSSWRASVQHDRLMEELCEEVRGKAKVRGSPPTCTAVPACRRANACWDTFKNCGDIHAESICGSITVRLAYCTHSHSRAHTLTQCPTPMASGSRISARSLLWPGRTSGRVLGRVSEAGQAR